MPQKIRTLRTLLVTLSAGVCGLVLSTTVGCNALGIGQSGPPRQKGEPQFSKCVSGTPLEKASNCAEYCATQNLGCQNEGCKHPKEQGKTYGGMSFDNTLCSGAPIRAYQCNDPFVSDGAVECCCVGL